MHRVKKLTALILALLLCLGNVFLYVGEVRAEDFPAEEVTEEALTEEETAETAVSEEEMAEEEAEKTTEETSEEMTEETTEESAGEEAEETVAGTDEVVAASSLTGATMPTGQFVYIYYNGSDRQYRWNINNTGVLKGECVHLDDRNGSNCKMGLGSVYENGVQYYSIMHNTCGFYIDSEGDNDKTGEVLHQYEKKIHQDNQKFRFVPVAGKEDVYYIMSKKGDNSNKSLYIGLENNSVAKHTKIVTTSTPTEWYVSTRDYDETAAMKGGEAKFAQDGPVLTFNPEGYIRDINIQNDHLSVDGSDLHLYYIGTASKFKAEWNEKYQGYYLRQKSMDESDDVMDLVWDVEGMKMESDTQIHMWSRKDNHPSQIWRFIPQEDNVYYVYNAYTGKYLSLRDKKDEDGVKVVQSETPMRWEVNTLDLVQQTTESANWMSRYPDEWSLGQLNIPGTHDTGATRMRGGNVVADQNSTIQCQQLYPDEQLNMGIRAFDVRCDPTDGDGDPDIVHGDSLFQCENRDGSSMSLSDIMNAAKNFLSYHPTECVIVTVKSDVWLGAGDEGNVAKAVASYVQDEEYPLWRENRIPTLGEARGKVILLRRYGLGSYTLPDGVEEWELGFDLSSWDNFAYDSQKNELEIFSMDVDDGDEHTITRNKVYVQEYYEADDEYTKMEWFYGTIDHATNNNITRKVYTENDNTIQQYAYLFNYTTSKDSLGRARSTNKLIMGDSENKIEPLHIIGITMLNYADCKTAEKIWETNVIVPSFMGEQTLSNEEHGISVSGKIQEGAKLVLVPLEDTSTEYLTLKNALQSGTLLRGWRFALVCEDGTEADWEGELSISIKKEAQEKLENLSVYHLNDAGECSKLDVKKEGEHLIFSVSTLGCFGVAQDEDISKVSKPDNNNGNTGTSGNSTQKPSTVKTGDTANVLPYIGLLLLSGAVLILCVVRRRRRA